MNKLVRRMATAAVSAAFVGGAVFAAGGPAAAAAPQTTGHIAAQVAVVQGGHAGAAEHTTVNGRMDPWIADQLAMFAPTAAHRTVTSDTWIAGQVAMFDHSVAHRSVTSDAWIMGQVNQFAGHASLR
ncbi:hypothetical protein [Streptomyces sp. NPDC052036]|uniref:hypothetical protein n=1 Tax=unclassified Streptomyces TaxID=2593676 RepID=UPI0034129D1D